LKVLSVAFKILSNSESAFVLNLVCISTIICLTVLYWLESKINKTILIQEKTMTEQMQQDSLELQQRIQILEQQLLLDLAQLQPLEEKLALIEEEIKPVNAKLQVFAQERTKSLNKTASDSMFQGNSLVALMLFTSSLLTTDYGGSEEAKGLQKLLETLTSQKNALQQLIDKEKKPITEKYQKEKSELQKNMAQLPQAFKQNIANLRYNMTRNLDRNQALAITIYLIMVAIAMAYNWDQIVAVPWIGCLLNQVYVVTILVGAAITIQLLTSCCEFPFYPAVFTTIITTTMVFLLILILSFIVALGVRFAAIMNNKTGI